MTRHMTRATRWPSPATDPRRLMTRNIFASALFAGLAAGLLVTALHLLWVTPLLLEGELYETGARVHFATDGSTQSPAGAPGIEINARHVTTAAINIVTFSAFGLLLAAAMGFAARAGHEVTPRRGALWGLGGFAAFILAPAVGLPPELPGTIGPEFAPRLTWWAATIAATAAGLALLAFARGLPALFGAALLAAPHLIGAPQIDTYFGIAPPELAAHFVTRSLAAALIAWLALGAIAGYVWTRIEGER